jgi:hypothetical protein
MEVANTSLGQLTIFGGGRTNPAAIEGGSANLNGEKKKEQRGGLTHPFWPNGVYRFGF